MTNGNNASSTSDVATGTADVATGTPDVASGTPDVASGTPSVPPSPQQEFGKALREKRRRRDQSPEEALEDLD